MTDIFGNETPVAPYVPLQSKYEEKTDIAADIVGFAGATLGDFATSVWNSLPGTEEVETADFLKRIDANSLRMYEENTEAVQAASFIGGVFVPAGIAMKGMTLARNGAKGVNWFSTIGRTEAMAETNNILRASGMASAEYKAALRGLYARDLANVVVDNAAAELAILGTMNAHPFMEDYMKDPVSSFMTSMVLGTAITAPISHIGVRGDVRRAAQAVYEPALGFIKGVTKEIDVTADYSTQIAAHQVNIDTYKDILNKVETKELEMYGVTKDLMSGFLRITEAQQVDTFAAMASKEVMEAPQVFKDALIKNISNNPDKFTGINTLSFAKAGDDADVLAGKTGKLFDSTKIEGDIPLTTTIKSGERAGELQPATAVYSQRFDAFMSKGDMKNFGVAADLGISEKSLSSNLPSNWFSTPRTEADIEALTTSTAKIDADFLQKLKAADELEVDKLEKIAVSSTDGPMLNAVLSRWEKLAVEDPTLSSSLKVKLDDKMVEFKDIKEAFDAFQAKTITSLAAQGLATESIALRVGMPAKSVTAIIGGAPFDHPDLITRSYTQASEIGTFLSLENRSIQLGTSSSKIPVAEIRANLQKKLMNDIDQGIKDVILSESKSQVVGSIASYLQRLETTSRIGMLKSYMEKITPANLGSKFFTSSDFTLRDMGNAKDLIIEFGKDAQHLKTAATNQILKPVSNAFASVTKDKAGSIEFITAQNINAGLSGYREYRAGALLMQDTVRPWTEIIDPMTGAVLGKERNMVPVMYQGKPFVITTPAVREAFEEMQKAGRELYELNSTYRKILGLPKLNDNGFWMPAFNPKDKFISYAFDRNLQTTKLIWGYSADELAQAEKAYFNSLSDTAKKNIDIIRKGGDQEAYNKIAGRHDDIFMSEASLDSFHSGSSASARVNTNMGVFSDLANGYEHYIHKSVEKILELQYSDVFQHLDKLSFISRKATEGNKGLLNIQALSIPHDPGSIVKNTMLAKSNLKDYTAWNQVQNGIQTAVEMTLQKVSTIFEPILAPAKGIFGSSKTLSNADYDNLIKEMETRGIPNPFQNMDDAVAREMFKTESLSQAPNMTPRLVALSNGLAATMMLRVMELGQPLVNMLSLPVLTSAAVQRQFKPEYLGAKLADNFHLSTTAAMYDGARFINAPEYQKFRKLGRELGVMDPVVSEVSELLQLTRSFNKGAMQGVENGLNSNLIQMLSKPADWSEKAVREFSFATGVSLAKKAYPDLSDSGVITFARNFMDTAIGNYQTSMRPTAFQGTMGTAMGLFQTYMVTLAQQIYGKLELRDYKSLAKVMLTQASIFGVKGLPGFNLVSEEIGNRFSDTNYDLTSGTYRAVGDDIADVVLYGLPSNLGPAVYTRGDIQPRIPNVAAGLDNLAAVNILKSGFNSAKTLHNAMTEVGNEGAAHAFAEALSVQSLSRPVARVSEFFTGHSVTQRGNQVAGPEEIYSAQGIAARVFATRSLQEAKAREATYLNTMYGAIDRDNRAEATKQLRNHIRSGTLTPEIRDRIMEKYMRTGSAQGWRSAMAGAIKDTDSPGVSAVRNHLSPNSPANLMIDDMD